VTTVGDVYDKLTEASDRIKTLHDDMTAANDFLKQLVDLGHKTVDTLDQGFAVLEARADITNAALTNLSAQTATVICNLVQVSRHTCDSLNELHWQTDLDRQGLHAMLGELAVLEGAYPAAALEYQRMEANRQALEACCPPEAPTPICREEPCDDPGPYRPPGPGDIR
jgi:hypothetical protein